ncbi:MAG: DUF5309 family protein [Planctomycetota bacterium]
MAFTGKATFSAGTDLPELAEDVADVIGIVSPYETPLLDHLGDPKRAATSTVHEWIEDELAPNTDLINQTDFVPSGASDTTITVDNGSRFRVGDLVRPEGGNEVMLLTAVSGNDLTVQRAYGGTSPFTLTNNLKLTIIGNGALEGADASDARFTNRVRQQNYTQIFTGTVQVSGSMQASRAYGVSDEVDFQKQERMRELLRDLENCVINGVADIAAPQGSSTVRRTMNGIVQSIETNLLAPGVGDVPSGGGAGSDLSEEVLNAALRVIWEQSSGGVDTLVVGGAQKRRINEFASADRTYLPEDERYRDLISVYESDYGVCRVILSRWVPTDTVLMVDSSRVEVLPLQGRSFHFKPLASTGDSFTGQVIGEYSLQFMNENAHGLLRGLSV